MEFEYFEFKVFIVESNWDCMIRIVVSFMNFNGGMIFCGVKDGGGELIYFVIDKYKVD